MKKLKAKYLILMCIASIFLLSTAIASGCSSGCESGDHPRQYLKTTLLDATCNEDGWEKITCTLCDTVVEEKILPATGDHIKDDGKVTKVPTCNETGVKSYFCKVCGTEIKKEEETLPPDPNAHIANEGTLIKEATCSKEGTMRYQCTVCGEEWNQSIPMVAHTFQLSENYWETDGYIAPTETHCAVIPYFCSVCRQGFAEEYSDTAFSFAKDIIRIEDKFSTDTPVVFDKDNQYLVINLAGSNTEKALQTLATEGIYDTQNKVLTIPAVYKTVQLKNVKIKGFKTPYDSFAITTEICNQVSLTLENISYTAPSGKVGLNLENTNKAHVEISGVVVINGGSNGMNGISAKQLEIIGSGSLTVAGGNGVNGTSSSGNGTDGGIGLKASTLTLSVDGVVNIVGGNGGTAYNRSTGDNDGDGSNGKDGYKGGNGGSGIYAESVIVTAGQYTIVGGNGARGGDGSECNRKETTWNGSDNVTGGRGGNGGTGADAIQAGKVEITVGTLSATGGNGGDSGKPGGCHDDDHTGFVFGVGTTKAYDGSAGTAGKGGKGLSESCAIEGDSNLITTQQGQDGKTTRELNQC